MEVKFSESELEPLIRKVVAEALAAVSMLPGDRLGLTEVEAAARMGVPRHVLRDARLRGEIAAKRVGRGYVYSVDALRRYLAGEAVETGRSAGRPGRRSKH